MNTLGTELKNIRGQKNLTQSDAAKQIGIEQSFLSKLESDQSWASVEVLQRICKAYGIRPAMLLSQVDSECLKGNVHYQSLLINDRKKRWSFMAGGALLASALFLGLWWAATNAIIIVPALMSVEAEFPRLNLQFEEIPAEDAFNLIADYGNLSIKNLALAKGKTVSINVENVPWHDALAIIADQCKLSVFIEGSVVILRTKNATGQGAS